MMLLNMDRNTLWGSAGGMVFESKNSWDVRDRMERWKASNKKVMPNALGALAPAGEGAALFNPAQLGAPRSAVIFEALAGKGMKAPSCQTVERKTMCSLLLPSVAVAGVAIAAKESQPSKIALPATHRDQALLRPHRSRPGRWPA